MPFTLSHSSSVLIHACSTDSVMQWIQTSSGLCLHYSLSVLFLSWSASCFRFACQGECTFIIPSSLFPLLNIISLNCVHSLARTQGEECTLIHALRQMTQSHMINIKITFLILTYCHAIGFSHSDANVFQPEVCSFKPSDPNVLVFNISWQELQTSLMDGVNVNVNKFRIKGKTTTMEEEIKVSNRPFWQKQEPKVISCSLTQNSKLYKLISWIFSI